jgi:hypothetical protein
MNKQIRHISHSQIAKLLTHGTQQLDDNIVSSLRNAREAALQKQRVHAPVFALSATGHHLHLPHSPRHWLAAAILLAALLIGAASYLNNAQELPGNPLDIAILTDDIPLEAFIDQ